MEMRKRKAETRRTCNSAMQMTHHAIKTERSLFPRGYTNILRSLHLLPERQRMGDLADRNSKKWGWALYSLLISITYQKC